MKERSSSILSPIADGARFFFCYFRLIFTAQHLEKLWSQVSYLLPGRCFPFVSRNGFFNSHSSSISIEMSLTHALALASSQFVHRQKALGKYTRMHLGALEITELIYAKQARG